MEVVHGSLDDDGSSRSSSAAAGSPGVLGFSEPRQVMQYRRMIAERRVVRAALEFAAAAAG